MPTAGVHLENAGQLLSVKYGAAGSAHLRCGSCYPDRFGVPYPRWFFGTLTDATRFGAGLLMIEIFDLGEPCVTPNRIATPILACPVITEVTRNIGPSVYVSRLINIPLSA
jgi:hypothetical protein